MKMKLQQGWVGYNAAIVLVLIAGLFMGFQLFGN